MAIRRRMGLPETDLHVMNRGARRFAIINDDEDGELFLALLGKFAMMYEVPILTWCLMPNHYHLQPRAKGTPLCQMMRELDRTYAQNFNRKYKASGCLFQGPFKSTLVGRGESLAYVSRYIHANPRDLGTRPEEYRWSSCRSYLGLVPVPPWLDPGPVLEIIRQPGKSDAVSYREYLAAVPPKRKRRADRQEEYDDFCFEFVRHLEEKYAEILSSLNDRSSHFSLRTVVCWAAHRIHRIPARILTSYYGYGSEGCIYTLVGRFATLLQGNPQLQTALSSVESTTTLKPQHAKGKADRP